MDRQAKFPTSATGWLFNIFHILAPFSLLITPQPRKYTPMLGQCSFSTITSQCCSVLSSALMTNIQFAPGMLPGFCRVRRGQLICGPRYPLPETKKSADLVHYFWQWGQFFFFLILQFNFNSFSVQGRHDHHAPHGYIPDYFSMFKDMWHV